MIHPLHGAPIAFCYLALRLYLLSKSKRGVVWSLLPSESPSHFQKKFLSKPRAFSDGYTGTYEKGASFFKRESLPFPKTSLTYQRNSVLFLHKGVLVRDSSFFSIVCGQPVFHPQALFQLFPKRP